MAMGTRKQREKQEDIWIAYDELASAPAHPFYARLNEVLEANRFDEFVEGGCRKFYAAKMGRRSLTPGIYFRSLLVGYFEGIDSERGIDISGQRSKSVDEFAKQSFEYVITVCDNAKESCPVFPGGGRRLHWSFDDPAAFDGTDEQRLRVFLRVRDEIEQRIREFLQEAGS